jgi:hypothetical protein
VFQPVNAAHNRSGNLPEGQPAATSIDAPTIDRTATASECPLCSIIGELDKRKIAGLSGLTDWMTSDEQARLSPV